MCGSEHNIRIERAGNGFVVDSYEPSSKGDRPGTHKRHVATDAEGVIHLVKKHLGKAKVEKKAKPGMRKVARRKR